MLKKLKKCLTAGAAVLVFIVGGVGVPTANEAGLRFDVEASAISDSSQTISLSGYIWNDREGGKNTVTVNDFCDFIEANSQTARDDVALSGKEVQLINSKTKTTYHAYSNENGYYKFDNVRIADLSEYSIKIEYDGLNYSLVNPNTLIFLL